MFVEWATLRHERARPTGVASHRKPVWNSIYSLFYRVSEDTEGNPNPSPHSPPRMPLPVLQKAGNALLTPLVLRVSILPLFQKKCFCNRLLCSWFRPTSNGLVFKQKFSLYNWTYIVTFGISTVLMHNAIVTIHILLQGIIYLDLPYAIVETT